MTLEELKLKRSELSERRNTLAAELATKQDARASLAFDAELGVESAKRQIAELTTAAAKLESELKTVDAALAECARRVSSAEAAAADAAQRRNAESALAMLEAFEERGAALTEKLSEFIDEYQSLCASFRRLERVGFAPTTYPLIASNMRRAVASALLPTDLRQEFLAPRDRITFVGVISGWASNVRARANATLRKTTATAA